ncbi:MAG: hypothetical protein HOP10_15985 [Chitinophagaceae bacterium]|nr:hypothetical protein [Chitinophagaceae bacterium]
MRRFSKGSGFSVLGDTVMITPANSGYYPSHDTLGISIRYASPGIISDLDYEFFLPGANRLYRLTDFTEIANEEKCGTKSSRMCRNTVPTVKVNNQASNTVPLGTYSSTLYIRR